MSELKSITQIINNNDMSNSDLLGSLFSALYPEVKKIANVQLYKNRPISEMSPTILVNECFIKLNSISHNSIIDKKHFYNMVSRCMRFYLVDLYRSQNRQKNAGQLTQLTEMIDEKEGFTIDILDLHDAIEKLNEINTELTKIVELKFFSGLSFSEIADLLETSKNKAFQKWQLAKSILFNMIDHD